MNAYRFDAEPSGVTLTTPTGNVQWFRSDDLARAYALWHADLSGRAPVVRYGAGEPIDLRNATAHEAPSINAVRRHG